VAGSFATTFWVAFALVLVTFIPIAFLPRRRQQSTLHDTDAAATVPVVVH
jgi:hypothetical protein